MNTDITIALAGYELAKLQELAEVLKISIEDLAIIFIDEVVHTH